MTLELGTTAPESQAKTEKKDKKDKKDKTDKKDKKRAGADAMAGDDTEPKLTKKQRKEARGGEKADLAARTAATADFLAAREAAEAAKAAAKAEAKAAKAEAAAQAQAKATTKREERPRATHSSDIEAKRGDWDCTACGAHCFANRTSCYKCGAAGGNARPGDWTCGPCGASCFASKDACYRCGAAKGTDGPGERHPAPKKEWTPTVANGGAASDLKDVTTACRDCRASFVVTAGEQDFYRAKGFDVTVPSRCKACTAAKKQRYGERYGRGLPGAATGAAMPAATVPVCYHCGQEGHMSRACPSGKSTTACFHCGLEGHMSRACPSARGGGLQCFNCGRPGHLARDCTDAKKVR